MDETFFKLYECISKVIVTDQCSKKYMDIFLKYPICAKLVDKTTGKKESCK